MKKILACLLCVILAVLPAAAAEPDIAAAGAVLMEKESGRVLWARNADEVMPMASTTKIMTAVLVLENAGLNDTVTVCREAVSAPKVKIDLQEGEHMTVEQLLYALMLRSANDAAVALAVHVGGSTDAFCRAMTEKAAALGCTDTVFVTPNGLDKGDHHSTPHDMAIIAAYALNDPDFVRIVNTKHISFSTDKKTYDLTTTDRFLSEYSGAMGIKTGFTGKAGHCFAGAAKRDGMTLISVVLASGWGSAGKNKKWTDTKALMDYGFENYKLTEVVKSGEVCGETEVKNGKKQKIKVVYGENCTLPLRPDERADIETRITPFINAPTEKGSIAGRAYITVNGEKLAELPLLTAESTEAQNFGDRLAEIIKRWTLMIK